MNAKTHVSILQEMMVKKGTVPNYDLIHDGGGTHINTFIYRVTCDGFVATGTGRCKKDAKHIAAKNMLETIAAARSYPQLPATPADSPVRTPLPDKLPASPKISPNEPFLNAIGDLKDLCAENELQDPEYIMISDVGPPHARIFTYQCAVSTFREEGRALTKKQAKHEASKKMLTRLEEVLADINIKDSMYSSLRKRTNSLEKTESVDHAKSLYPEISKVSTRRVNLGVKLMDYHVKLKKTFNDDTIPTRQEVLKNLDSILVYIRDIGEKTSLDLLESVKSQLTEFLTSINLDFCSIVYDCTNERGNKIILAKINCIPDIVEIEIGNDLVAIELSAITKTLKSFQLFME